MVRPESMSKIPATMPSVKTALLANLGARRRRPD